MVSTPVNALLSYIDRYFYYVLVCGMLCVRRSSYTVWIAVTIRRFRAVLPCETSGRTDTLPSSYHKGKYKTWSV